MKQKLFIALAILLAGYTSCNKFLDQAPQGVISCDQLNTPENVDKMVIAAYSELGNEQIHTSYSLWPWGSMRSGDAYKGGDGPGDNSEWNDYETFVTNRVDNSITDQMWAQLYAAISRVNDALARVNAIGDEFRYAADHLPETQADAGRPTRFTAKAYLAKTLLYQAYKQDENNSVTSIDQAMLQQVNSLCDEVINSGKYSLDPAFAQNFLSAYENSKESVFAIQYSKNDGSPFGRIDMGHALDYPMNKEFGCCWQHIPSQDMVNAFKTDAGGLPEFNSYNSTDATGGADFLNQSFDPRLDHTVAILGHPWKDEPNFVYQKFWARAPQIYGPFTSLKECVAPDDPAFQKIPPFMSSSKNWELILMV